MSHTTTASVATRLGARVSGRGVLAFALFVILTWQAIIPFLIVLWTSLKIVRPGDPQFLTWTLSANNFTRVLGESGFLSTLANTLLFAGGSTLLAFAFGAFIAWVVERTDAPFARVMGAIVVARVVIPTILITISWILIASPRIGILNFIWRDVFGVTNFFNIYSLPGMIWVFALELSPLAFLLMAAAFRGMDPRLEEAATMAGAGLSSALKRIVLPLATPAVGAALLLMFIAAIETFEVPLLMGARAGVRVFASEIFLSSSRTPIDWGMSSAYSIVMIGLTLALLALYLRLVRHSARYQTMTGKDFRPRRIALRGWRYPIALLAMLLIFLMAGVPLIIMIYASLLPTWQPPSMAWFKLATFANYLAIWRNPTTATALTNSTLLGLGSATCVALFAALLAWTTKSMRGWAGRALDVIAFAPVALPSVVLGAAFLWLYLIVPAPVVGTLVIIGLAYLTKYLPVALRFLSASMAQMHAELDDAGRMAGAAGPRVFAKITLPLLKPGLMGAWFWVMVHAYRELTIALMLARSQNRTTAVLILDMWEQGSFLRLSAFGVVIFSVLLLLVGLSRVIMRSFGLREQI